MIAYDVLSFITLDIFTSKLFGFVIVKDFCILVGIVPVLELSLNAKDLLLTANNN